MRTTFLQLSSVLATAYFVQGSETTYSVRRRTHHIDRELNTDDFFLTHSDEGKSKVMDSFALDMFTTPDVISDTALPVLRMAMNKFLLAEFNAIYLSSGYGLESVGSEVLDIDTTSTSTRRALQTSGTEATMAVDA